MTENKRFEITDDGIVDTVRLKQYKKIKSSDNILDSISFTHLIDVVNLLNELNEENEQLEQRNTNQYNQLNQLWQLIETKDWETLTAMDNQMKEYEEQLQKEWKCYE